MNAFKPAFRPAIRPAITSVFGVQVPVVEPLSFVSQPQSKTVDEYSLATFSCEVTGGVAPYTYQYKKNGVNIGTNSAALSFTAAATDKNASITVTVTDSVGTVIASSAAILSVTSYQYIYDGITQHAVFTSVIPVLVGDIIYVDFKAPTEAATDYQAILSRNAAYSAIFMLSNNGTYSPVRADLQVDGTTKTGSSLHAIDGINHVAKLTVTTAFDLSLIAAQWSTVGASVLRRYGNGISKLIIERGGTVIHKIPLNNKSQGANQLATIGGVNVNIVNYNSAGWLAV